MSQRRGPHVQLVAAAPAHAVPLRLDPAQQRAVDHVATPASGPLLVLAGPGTGKTATLVEAVAARVARGAAPERILVLTFSRKAAHELRDRIAARLGPEGVGVAAWTFHAFCYALTALRTDDQGQPDALRLLSGPEQDAVVRDLLAGHREEGFVQWPRDLQPALATRGFADELRGFIAHIRSRGLDPGDVEASGRLHDRPAWVAAGAAAEEYLDVLAAAGRIDYTELVVQAAAFASSGEGRHLLRGLYDAVVVDEYQDTDPLQAELLAAIAGDGRDLVVVGDPDQSIYAFRGADVRGIAQFPDRFRTASGDPAPVVALQVCRRSGAVLVEAAAAVAARLPLSGALVGAQGGHAARSHRDRIPAEGLDPGEARVLTFSSVGAQYDSIVDLLRRAHLDDGMAWAQMAVLVRSGARSIPGLRRAMGAGGIPVEVASDEIPVAQEPTIAPLLRALTASIDPDALSAADVRDLLLSPLGGADPGQLRRIGRALRDEARAGGSLDVPPSGEAIRAAVLDVRQLLAHDTRDAGPLRRLGALLASAHADVGAGASAHQVLWMLWDQAPWREDHLLTWADRLERNAWSGGAEGRRADRELDAVLALFELAAREDDVDRAGSPLAFLEHVKAQEIPADTLAERGVRPEGVRLLTAHRSKGLEWDVVVVADVQEDLWPNARSRGSVLEGDRLSDQGLTDPPTAAELVAEERRLFYVAVTRARQRLIVTAVDSATDDGPRASRFLADLGLPVESGEQHPRRPLSLTGLVADLRRALEDDSTPADVQQAAVQVLADLASLTSQTGPLVPGAHPDHWWGALNVTASDDPIYPKDRPLRLSGSSLEGLDRCALKWFLAHEARGEGVKGTAMGFGSVVHAIADEAARSSTPVTLAEAETMLDAVWRRLDYEAEWISERERSAALEAIGRFLAWHDANPRELLATEHPFETTLVVGGREVLMRGSMDRVERDSHGRVVVVDLKTMKKGVTAADLEHHVQLGVYQRVVTEGAVAGLAGDDSDAVVGGAELVQLRVARKDGQPQVQVQAPLDQAPEWLDTVLDQAVQRLTLESFPPDPIAGNCAFCPFTSCCPAQDDGGGVVS